MNAEVVETQFDENVLLGIKADLSSMEECRNQPRGKGIGSKLYVSRQSTGSIHRGY